MSNMQRRKGGDGERELAGIIRDLTGWDVRRRVRQHDGDSDLVGVPGWAIEVKRHRTALPGEIAKWWTQTVAQAQHGQAGDWPVLFYRADRCEWQAVFPLAVAMGTRWTEDKGMTEWTVTGSIEAWATVAREAVTAEAA